MSVGLTINGVEPVGQMLAGLSLALSQPGDLLKVLEREGTNRLRSHFLARDTVGNRLGGRRTNFWRQMADSLRSSVSGAELKISVTDPRFVQKVYGGTLVPKRAKALAVPVDREAYGRTPETFQSETRILLFLVRKKGGGFTNLLAGYAGGVLKVFYVLKSSVTQEKDPDALPDREGFAAGLLERARDYVGRITGQQLPGAPLPPPAA